MGKTFNLADLLTITAAQVPESEALVCNDERRTFRRLVERSESLSRWLKERGVGAGDTVGIQAYNSIQHLEAYFAAFLIRAVPLNVNYRYTADECRYLYGDAGLAALVYQGAVEPAVAAALPAASDLKALLRIGDGGGRLPQAVAFEKAVAAGGAPLGDIGRSDDDLVLVYTGGTTGMPKGVMWTHKALFFGCLGGGGAMSPSGPVETPEQLADRVTDSFPLSYLPCAPLMHGAGMWSVLTALLVGRKVVLNGRPDFRAEHVLDLLDREKVTCLAIVGDAMAKPLCEALEANPGRWSLASLISLASAGALFSAHLRERLKTFLPPMARIINNMGSSESGAMGPEGRAATEGMICLAPNPSNRVAVDRVRFARPGEKGILVRLGHLPQGYFKDAKKTAETFVEIEGQRCVLTGDAARLEADGSITLFGRDSQCINTGGEKVFAEEVEEVLRGREGVADALAVGLPDARWGQRLVAVVALQPGDVSDAESIKAHCRSRLAGYKVPKDVVFVEQVVRTPTGKADYRWAKSAAQAVLGIFT